jgi:hypothetical protein
MLSRLGRTALVKSTLSAIPLHISVAVKLCPSTHQDIDKIRRGFIWCGTSSASGGRCMVAWPKVTRSIELGRLGVPDLAMPGHALCLRWSWLAHVDPSHSWSAISSKGDKIEQVLFEASTSVSVGSSEDTWFWCDKWIISLAPDLLVAVDRRAFRVRMVAQALQNNRWVADITGSLSALGLQQYLALWERMEAFHCVESMSDRFRWKWMVYSQYFVSLVYRAFFIDQTGVLNAKELHKTRVLPVCKFFVWLALLGRCWTSERLQCHSLPNNGA